ncbi:PGR5-like protein 1A, chloroplastic [Sesamum angolense]|uniref:PGR5-like protein 1A, chloroplastic n=1 Tax=Sesamum angolense TaxID=2727404 RepID=A0AAE1W9S1_9LAMI|nr:PGR5-like protein 1A, chloroplastic [Sesamum angolense]
MSSTCEHLRCFTNPRTLTWQDYNILVRNRFCFETTTSIKELLPISPPHISTYLIFELSPLPTKTHQISRVPRSSNAPIYKTPTSILLLPLPPPATPPQMASRLGFTVTKPRFFTAQFRNPFFSVSLLPSSAPGVQFGAKKLSFRRRLLVLSPKATTDQPGFLLRRKAIMSNEEFDNLKEELMWEGSSVVMLSADEQRFLEASMAYVSGTPIMTDDEFDKLKQKLKMDGSEIVVEGPRCSLRSRKVYSDLSVDYLKMFLLNVPAAVVALGLFFFLDDLTGFEITYLLELPEPFSFLFTWFAALPFILWLSFTITNFIVKDFLILVGPCPNCGTENTSFFGTILSISSGGSVNNVKCSNCGTDMVYDSQTRLITLPEGSEA